MAQTTLPSSLQHDLWTDIAGGRLMLRAFDAAPFPHASRDNGYESRAGKFPRELHYADSTVGLFIPPDFNPGEAVHYVVHFHGHRNHVANAIIKHQLLQQMADAKVNAILIVPQGPYDAPDSGGGKLELDDGGFRRLITEVTAYLKRQNLLTTDRVGHITLSAHSGGYKVAAGILQRGGMNDHITDVILLDATYGQLSSFVDFLKAQPASRIVSFHTKHLDDENAELRRLLDEQHVASHVVDEANMQIDSLSSRGVIFIPTQLAHDAVPYERGYFREALRSADLPARSKH